MDEIILGANQLAAILAVVLGAFGLFIANLFQAIKAKAEAQKTRAEAAEIKKNQKQVLDQFKNNGGSTLKDATDRIEENLKDATGRLEAQLRTIRGELGFQRREIIRLAEVDVQDRELAHEVHKDLKRLMVNVEDDLKKHITSLPVVLENTKTEILKSLVEKEQKG